MRRLLPTLAVPLLAALALAHGTHPSGADFVASSAHGNTTFATATAFNSVAVSVTNPGSPLRGTATIAAVATSEEPMASVRIQRSPAGAGTWTDVCTDTIAPYTCDWATTGVSDGLYDLRAIAADTAGYSQTSAAIAGRRVDNTAPAVTVTDPGTPVSATRTLTTTATDGGSGVASVTMEYRTSPSGGWTPICTDTTSAYTCSWATASLPDGLYDLRATSTDVAGNSATSAVIASRRVDNTAPSVSVIEDGTPRHGNAVLAAIVDDGNGSGVASVTMEIQVTGTWTFLCADTAASYSCTGNTSGVPDGLYPLRATATDYAGFSTTSAPVQTRIDNTAPSSATITNPGTPISGTKALAGTAADGGSGIASLRFDYRLNGSTGAWSPACTDSSSPFTTCDWDTTTVADGSYDMRSVATDLSGLTTASATVAARIVDNNGPTTAVTNPGALLRASVTVGATATDVSGVTSVAIQYSPAGTNTWTTICTDLASAYSCAWNTSAVTDGSYDLRARATDTTGKVTTSAVVASRTVNNASPAATDIQGSNNGGTTGRLDNGDRITFTYSQTIRKSSIYSLWTGTTLNLTVRVIDNGTSDYLDFYDSTNTNRLNLTASASGLETKANHVTANGVRFAATATQASGVITVTLGAVTGTPRSFVTTATTMTWTPSTSATNATGLAVLPLSTSESGFPTGDF
jgi:chitinase